MNNTRLIRLSLIAAIGAWIGVGLIIVSIIEFSGGMNPADYVQMLLAERPLLGFFLILPSLAIILTVFSFRRVEQVTDRGVYFSSLFKSSPVAIVTLDLKQRVIAANPSFEELFGYREKEILGKNLDPLIATDSRKKEARELTAGVIAGEEVRVKTVRRRKDGGEVDVELYGVPVEVAGERVGALGLYQDVSDREKARREQRESEQKYRDIFDNTLDFLYSHDLEGRITGANPSFVSSSGFELDGLLEMSIEDLMPEDHKRFFHYYLAKVKKKGKSEGLLHIQTKQGQKLVVEYKNSLIQGPDGPIGVRGSARDISARLELEQQLKDSMSDLDQLARTDPLTSLLNRRGIREHLEMERKRAERLEIPLSVAMIDLDRLKEINDTYGHQEGDEALKAVAAAVLKCIRSYDRVGRHGGDEFLIVFPGATLEQTAKVCARISATVQATQSARSDFFYSASTGFATFDKVGQEGETIDSLEQVLANADEALYKAKDGGGGKVVCYDTEQKTLSEVLT